MKIAVKLAIRVLAPQAASSATARALFAGRVAACESTRLGFEGAEGLRLGRGFSPFMLQAACPVQVLVRRNLPNLHNAQGWIPNTQAWLISPSRGKAPVARTLCLRFLHRRPRPKATHSCVQGQGGQGALATPASPPWSEPETQREAEMDLNSETDMID